MKPRAMSLEEYLFCRGVRGFDLPESAKLDDNRFQLAGPGRRIWG
jgi:hypothetical protein